MEITPKATITLTNPDSERFILNVRPAIGTKVKSLFKVAPDIKAHLQWGLFEPYEENNLIYLAVSKSNDNDIRLFDILGTQMFSQCDMKLPIVIGMNMKCEPVLVDFAKIPHLLYGGATGMGKSVALQNFISCLIINPVEKINIIIVDCGASDLDIFDGIPHLSCPIVKDEFEAYSVICGLQMESERRKALSDEELDECPEIVLVVDEAVSLFQNIYSEFAKPLIEAINNLLRHGRHAKIHLVFGTQDPSKANLKIACNNFTARAAFGCRTHQDSEVIIGQGGAEKLEKEGAMLYVSPNNSKPMHIQGAYISKEEIKRIISLVKESTHDLSKKFIFSEANLPATSPDKPVIDTSGLCDKPIDDSMNQLIADVAMKALAVTKISRKKLTDSLHISEDTADIILDKLFKMGIVSELRAKQPREVLPKDADDISAEGLEFISKYGYSREEVSEAISKRIKQEDF